MVGTWCGVECAVVETGVGAWCGVSELRVIATLDAPGLSGSASVTVPPLWYATVRTRVRQRPATGRRRLDRTAKIPNHALLDVT
jgi:hypothetical protein